MHTIFNENKNKSTEPNIFEYTMKMNIRTANNGDLHVIVEFNALMAKETEHKELNHETLQKGVDSVLKDSTKGIYYIAEIDDIIAGQLLITYEWSDWRNSNFWWIQSVYVRKEYRNMGVFTALFKHIELLAKRNPTVCGIRLYVEKTNDRAKSTYEKIGLRHAAYDMYEMDFVPV